MPDLSFLQKKCDECVSRKLAICTSQLCRRNRGGGGGGEAGERLGAVESCEV